MSRAVSPAPRIPALRGVASPVRRNMLLAAGMAALYGMVELAAAVATLTFEAAGGSRKLASLALAVFLATAALAALPAGRTMDRLGRAAALRAGFATGICGSLIAALGAFWTSVPVVVLVVGADDVARPKPAPDLYLAAVRLLEAEPAATVAVEDSPAGSPPLAPRGSTWWG